MTRILTILAAIAILVLLVFVFSDRDPAEETELPTVDAPDVGFEDGTEPDAELEVAPPREVDPELEVEPMDVEVVREGEGPPEVDVTLPEGEGQIDDELDETPDDATLETEEPETETGDDQPPKSER